MELEDRSFGIIQSDKNKEMEKKMSKAFLKFGASGQIYKLFISPRAKKQKGLENLLNKIIVKNFPCLVRDLDIQVKEAQ